jgi:hypothetical protein
MTKNEGWNCHNFSQKEKHLVWQGALLILQRYLIPGNALKSGAGGGV